MEDERTRQIVVQFLRACVAYAEDSIERKRARGDPEEVIAPWTTYVQFTKHSILEVENGSLDHWLTAMHDPAFRPVPSSDEASKIRHELEEVNVESSSVSQALRGTPIYLVGTTKDGVANVSAISSIMPVSLSPPLLAMSIGARKDGHARDTIRNAEHDSTVRIMRLPSNVMACADILAAAEPVEPERSEWDDMNDMPIVLAGEFVHPQATEVIDCVVEDILVLPGRSARLVLLKPTHIWRVPSMRMDAGPLVEGDHIRLRTQHVGETRWRNQDTDG